MREGSCEGEKKQSKSSTTNMPLSLLMVSTSPYSGSLQLAIKVLTVVDSWCSCLSAGQVVQSCIQTHTICYFHWCLAHTEGIIMLYFSLSLVFFFTLMAPRSTIFHKVVWKTSFSYFYSSLLQVLGWNKYQVGRLEYHSRKCKYSYLLWRKILIW